MVDFPEMREAMVDCQVLPEGIVSSRLLDAMLNTPREYFVPRQQQHIAYMDDHFLLSYDRFLLRPVTLAKMIQVLDPQPHEKALIVGCNLGYSMAIISKLVHFVLGVEEVEVHSKEAEKTLERVGIKNFEVIMGRHDKGYAAYGPYDIILIEGTIEREPEVLLEQLKDNGRLVAITSCPDGADTVTLYTRIKGHVSQNSVCDGSSPTLTSFEHRNGFKF